MGTTEPLRPPAARILKRTGGAAAGALLVAAFAGAGAAAAQASDVETLQRSLVGQEQKLREQQAQIDKAQVELAAQQTLIDQERREIDALKSMSRSDVASVSGRGVAVAVDAAAPLAGGGGIAQLQPNNQIAVTPPAGDQPVGEAPPAKEVDASVLPMSVSILTAPGHFILETDGSYVETDNNRLTFQGIELVPGVEIGALAANSTERNLSVLTQSVRYGVAPRWEIQLSVPYVYENARVTEAVQRDNQVSETTNLRGSDIGDVEVTARYQINSGQNGWPILIGNLMVKPPTGRGPFDLKYDQFGDALNLPTGSGFWGLEPSVTMLYTSDPAVLFANLGYLYQFSTDVNKTIGGALVGNVEPGGAIDGSFGFAFALNQKFSFSLGYQETYFRDTYEHINGTRQRSYSLQVGSLLFGTSFRITDKTTISTAFQFGVTSDAPNLTATVRLPFYF